MGQSTMEAPPSVPREVLKQIADGLDVVRSEMDAVARHLRRELPTREGLRTEARNPVIVMDRRR